MSKPTEWPDRLDSKSISRARLDPSGLKLRNVPDVMYHTGSTRQRNLKHFLSPQMLFTSVATIWGYPCEACL